MEGVMKINEWSQVPSSTGSRDNGQRLVAPEWEQEALLQKDQNPPVKSL